MQMSETNKPKLTIDEQIQNMKDKNIQFSIVNEKEAEKFSISIQVEKTKENIIM